MLYSKEIHINSLVPGRSGYDFKNVIFNFVWLIGWHLQIFLAIPLGQSPSMALNLIDDKSTLVKVMACCHQATSHYLSQSWPRSMLPYGVTRPQWVSRKVSIFNRNTKYPQTSSIRHTKSQNLNVSHLILQLSLPNPLKPGVKSRMKM